MIFSVVAFTIVAVRAVSAVLRWQIYFELKSTKKGKSISRQGAAVSKLSALCYALVVVLAGSNSINSSNGPSYTVFSLAYGVCCVVLHVVRSVGTIGDEGHPHRSSV